MSVLLRDRALDGSYNHLRVFHQCMTMDGAVDRWPVCWLGDPPPDPARIDPALVRRLSAQYCSQSVAVKMGMMPVGLVQSLSSWYSILLAVGIARQGDVQDCTRQVIASDPVGNFMGASLRELAERVAQCELEFSYSYFSAYQLGSSVPPHVDHGDCFVTLGVVLRSGRNPWPLRISASEGTVGALRNAGDVAVFSGSKLVHWREALSDASFWTLLFHYRARV